MDETTDGVAVAGGQFNALYKVADRAAGKVVAKCHEDNDEEADVRTMTEARSRHPGGPKGRSG